MDIDALINKGGSVATEENVQTTKGAKTVGVLLHLPVELRERIAATLRTRPIKIPRHTWILEAIVEKLEREIISIRYIHNR